MKSVMDGRKIIAARWQPPNLKSLLFCPRFEGQVHTTPGSVTACCKIKRKARGQPCKCCDNINECSSFLFHGSNEPFELQWHFNCDTMNILYALTCQTCELNYIGQMERSVREQTATIEGPSVTKNTTLKAYMSILQTVEKVTTQWRLFLKSRAQIAVTRPYSSMKHISYKNSNQPSTNPSLVNECTQ